LYSGEGERDSFRIAEPGIVGRRAVGGLRGAGGVGETAGELLNEAICDFGALSSPSWYATLVLGTGA
jgi:hypothetical protein